MEKLLSPVKQFIKDEEGASAVEYGVLVALIIVACIATIQVIGTRLNLAFTHVKDNLPAT